MRRTSLFRAVAAPFAVVAVAATGACAEKACTAIAVAGASVTVTDAAGARVCDATVVVIEDDYQETLEVQGEGADCSYVGLYERAGVYDLDVFKDGFRRVLQGDALRIGETDDGCHVVPESATVELEAE